MKFSRETSKSNDSSTNQKSIENILSNIRSFEKKLSSIFVCREEEVEQLVIAALAQEPLLLIGPPGTAKSELITQFRTMIGIPVEEYFEYTLTKFTEPSEIMGPLDLKKMKDGAFVRRTGGKLPEAKLAFLDEVFKSNSAILNTLLTVLNEKKFYQDGRPTKIPLKLLFAATNEIPTMTELDALKDRFILKVQIDPVGTDNWDKLIEKGVLNQSNKFDNKVYFPKQYASLQDFEDAHAYLINSMKPIGEGKKDTLFSPSLYMEFKRLIKMIQDDYNIPISDRKIIKIYKLIRARALYKRGGGVEKEDFKLLVHLGNQAAEILALKEKLPKIIEA